MGIRSGRTVFGSSTLLLGESSAYLVGVSSAARRRSNLSVLSTTLTKNLKIQQAREIRRDNRGAKPTLSLRLEHQELRSRVSRQQLGIVVTHKFTVIDTGRPCFRINRHQERSAKTLIPRMCHLWYAARLSFVSSSSLATKLWEKHGSGAVFGGFEPYTIPRKDSQGGGDARRSA